MMTDPAASQPGTHLDPDQLADLFEGLLEPAATKAATGHLASCRLCSADFALIAGETGFADLLPPVPIPQDVVIRVEAALHREPPLSAAPAASATASSAPASHVATRPRRKRFRLAIGSLAGATLVIVGGIGAVATLNNGESKSGSGNSAAARGTTQPNAGSSGTDKTEGTAPQGMSPQVGGIPDRTAPGAVDNTLGVQQQAEGLIGGHMSAPANGTSQSAAPQCLPNSVPTGAQLLAGTQIRYQGKPASLLVYSQPGSTTVADVYVVDLDSCTSGKTGQAVVQTTIPRS